MYMVEISENKVEKMSDYAEKMLRYGGKLMQCLEELSEGESMGQREYLSNSRNYILKKTMTTIMMITTMMKWVNAAGMAVVDTETVEVIPVE